MNIFKNVIEAADNLKCTINGDQIFRNNIPIASIQSCTILVDCNKQNECYITESTTVKEIEGRIRQNEYLLEIQLLKRFEQACLLLNLSITNPWHGKQGNFIDCWGYYTKKDDNVVLLKWKDSILVASNLNNGSIKYELSPIMTVNDIVNILIDETESEDERNVRRDEHLAEIMHFGQVL